ncbi:MAG: twin-arginine translocase TatA/TatE family subunit [Candidatus Levybacteria bacterium CG_4_10_14_0_2_um_filter_35_8]|nr:MAG: twin-arginine translocase TatA/TatE family subunit [Candidatus Levybacteria bacterium CG22_combo_CG10-13_8_21_14_all_35_11]PIR56597.1 MAG: twin-arginine translocase TatA/TatE family subunit [Parcubacteria group bacterium CG10_big_fil_rev_8_21_14_0_10_41_35]PJA00124.1 MAG: twin-arginine translocase TatA/TatE family subunit [Candidatus Levybacteria bacterium CG_4_10_14_0_2_um_filter_35_8]
MFSNFGSTEIIVIALLIILFFGGKKIPEFIKGLGEAIKEFRKGVKEDKK